MRIAWMIERKIEGAGKDWIPFKLAGEPASHVTRASAQKEAKDRTWRRRTDFLWTYRAIPYLPRVDSTGRRR